MEFKIVEAFNRDFEKEVKILVDQGYWFVSDIKTNIIQDQILYSVLLKKV